MHRHYNNRQSASKKLKKQFNSHGMKYADTFEDEGSTKDCRTFALDLAFTVRDRNGFSVSASYKNV